MIAGAEGSTSPVGTPGREPANPGMSPEEIGQRTLEELHSDHSLIRVLSGTPEVVLARWVNPDELAAFTAARVCSLDEYERLVLVVIKGDFELAVPGATAVRSTDRYAFRIFDQDGQDMGGLGGYSTDESYQMALVQLNAAASAPPEPGSSCEEGAFPATPIPDRQGAVRSPVSETAG
ncbi:hypothetical protein [Nitrolancea hollandica]|uniref:Uncharacterized protein n=1 Tax=Nitrolancea hollandica Lb TaxID=1129897 RepID=I4EGI0_9BACT|nr:hypothetical protein [Nitrolancea hollandica]CCF83792.1 hypothetical protein NITHO_2710015 [Nitrolancea hollandica Lb]